MNMFEQQVGEPMLRVRLDACVETDGIARFNGLPLTGVAFSASESSTGLLAAYRYENGVRLGIYEEPLLDHPNQPMLENLPKFYPEPELGQVVFNGTRFDGILVAFQGPHVRNFNAVAAGDCDNDIQMLSWNAQGSLTQAARLDYSLRDSSHTKVRQFVVWPEQATVGPDGSMAYRTEIKLRRGSWATHDRPRLVPGENTEATIFKPFSKGQDGHRVSWLGIGFDFYGQVDYLSTFGSDFFAYLREEAPQFTPVADFPRSWSEVVSSMASPRLELDLRPSDLDAVVEAAGGYGWFDSVEELVIRPDEVNRDQADQLFNAAALQSLTIKQRGGSIDPVIAAACEDLATRRPDVNVVLES